MRAEKAEYSATRSGGSDTRRGLDAGVASGDGFTHGGVMTSMAGLPGAGDGDAVALGVFSGVTPLGNGVGHGCGNANQCSVNPLATEALMFLPK